MGTKITGMMIFLLCNNVIISHLHSTIAKLH